MSSMHEPTMTKILPQVVRAGRKQPAGSSKVRNTLGNAVSCIYSDRSFQPNLTSTPLTPSSIKPFALNLDLPPPPECAAAADTSSGNPQSADHPDPDPLPSSSMKPALDPHHEQPLNPDSSPTLTLALAPQAR